MIELRKCTKSFKGRPVLENVDLVIQRGKIVSFLGPSGSGKTTLLRVIMGLESVDEGEVAYDGRVVTCCKRIIVKPEDRPFSIVFQDFMLFPHLDVRGNIVIGIDRLGKHEKETRFASLVEALEIGHLVHRMVDTLSGGEQQRVAICRALALQPDIVMFDEPFSNLDTRLKERLYGKLKKLLAELGTTAIFATHDHEEAFFFSDTIYVLKDGKIEDGNTPYLIYTRPSSPWIASFIGDVNYLSGGDCSALIDGVSLQLKSDAFYLVRPEEFVVTRGRNGSLSCEIETVDYYGFYRTIGVKMQNGKRIRVKDFTSVQYLPGDAVSVRITKEPETLAATETRDHEGIES